MNSAKQASLDSGHSPQPEVRELQRDLVEVFSFGLIALGGGAALLALPGPEFSGGRFLVFASLLATGCGARWLLPRWRACALALLLLGPTLSLALALRMFDSPAVPSFAVLNVIANFAIDPMMGVAAALLSTLVLSLGCQRSALLLPSLALVWLGACTAWASWRELYTALAWAWRSEERANLLLERLRDRHGELNRTLAALTEATRRLERNSHELAVARMRADEARQMKEQLAANISHELRTPLSLIVGFSEVMFLSPEVYGKMRWPKALRQDIRQIYQSSRHLLDLVNDVLDLSRIDAGQMPIRKERSDLRVVIEEALELTAGLLQKQGLELYVDLPSDIPLFSFDRARVRQVLINLLNNARRFTEKGHVAIRVRVRPQEVIVSVADTGVGIPPEELSRVFEEFHQADMSLRRRQEGAGLGLTISKRFIELHGGRMWVESKVGQGSTFHFSLPLTSEAAAPPLLLGRVPRPEDQPGVGTLVVVDPDPALATLLSRYIEGFQILQVRDLAQARDVAHKYLPQAVLLNVPLQGSTSPGLPEGVDDFDPHVPVIVCSLPSWAAKDAGARSFLEKPVESAELMRALACAPEARDVLIVDQDRDFVQLVTRLLQAADRGYTVRAAYSGDEALAQVAEKRPDIILLDVRISEAGGRDLLRAARATSDLSETPVLLLTTSPATCTPHRNGPLFGVYRRDGLSTTDVIRYLKAVLSVPQDPCCGDSDARSSQVA